MSKCLHKYVPGNSEPTLWNRLSDWSYAVMTAIEVSHIATGELPYTD